MTEVTRRLEFFAGQSSGPFELVSPISYPMSMLGPSFSPFFFMGFTIFQKGGL